MLRIRKAAAFRAGGRGFVNRTPVIMIKKYIVDGGKGSVYNLLIVDDEQIIRSGLACVIRKGLPTRYCVAGAVSNGEEAMDFVRTQPVDVALIDIKMPRMDGVALSAQLAAEFPEICKILISGYGEFAYAQQAIRYKVYRYLLKPTDPEELCSILEQLAAEMDRQRMTKPEDVQLLWESFFHRPDVTGAARLAKALPSAAAGILLVCPEQGALKPTLNPLTGWAAHREDGRTAILLPLEAHAPTGVAKAYFEDLSHRAAKTLSGAWSFGGRDEILKTLISAERKLDGMFYAPGRLIEVLEPLGGAPIIQSAEVQALCRNLIAGDRSAVCTSLAMMFARWCMGRCGCEMTVKAALNQLLMRLADGLQRELRRQDFCLDENLCRAFEQTHTLDAMERALRMLLEDVLSQVQAMRRNSGCQLLIQANQYLKQYCGQTLDLKQLALHLNVSPSHLSHLYRREMDTTFREMLNKIRMERACELLLETDDRIYEVAEKCGFSTPRYFSEVFRDYMGMTPNEYREYTGKEK